MRPSLPGLSRSSTVDVTWTGIFSNLKHAWRVFKRVSQPAHGRGALNSLRAWACCGTACSEITPFKLDLDNSSERTSCFLDPPRAPVGVLTAAVYV